MLKHQKLHLHITIGQRKKHLRVKLPGPRQHFKRYYGRDFSQPPKCGRKKVHKPRKWYSHKHKRGFLKHKPAREKVKDMLPPKAVHMRGTHKSVVKLLKHMRATTAEMAMQPNDDIAQETMFMTTLTGLDEDEL